MMQQLMALDRACFIQKVLIFLHENICCEYSLEVSRRGTSNEYPQHIFSWRYPLLSGAMQLLNPVLCMVKAEEFYK